MSTTNDFLAHKTDIAEMPKVAMTNARIAHFQNINTMSKKYDEVYESMFGGLDDDLSETNLAAWKEEIKDVFDYHLSKVRDICKYIVSESQQGKDTEDFMQVTYSNIMLGSLEVVKTQTNSLIENLTEDMSERLFVEYCERPC